jgi:hypothetical protein
MLRVVREIGASCGPAIPLCTDYMHYDLAPANLVTDGATITGVAGAGRDYDRKVFMIKEVPPTGLAGQFRNNQPGRPSSPARPSSGLLSCSSQINRR